MANDSDPVLRRFADALRRLWWIVLACVLGFAALLGSTGSSVLNQTNAVTTQVALVDPAAATTLADIKNAPVPQLTVGALVDAVTSDGTRQRLLREAGRKADVAVRGNVTSQSIILTVRADSLATAKAVSEAFVTDLRTIRNADLQRIYQSSASAIDARLAATSSRIAEIDDAVGKLTDRTSPLAFQLEQERQTLLETRADQTGLRAVVNQLLGVTDGGLSILRNDEVTSSRKAALVSRVILGVIAGAVVGGLIVLLTTFFDQRVRTRSDAEEVLGDGAVLGIVPVAGSPVGLLGAGLSRRAAGRRIVVTGVGRAPTAAFTAALSGAAPDGAGELAAVDGGEQGLQVDAVGPDGESCAVILLQLGRATRAELASAQVALRGAGVDLIGVVFVSTGRTDGSALSH